jgi:hypothetical protein
MEPRKPSYQWCKHCDIGVGCKIYKTRPQGCKDFLCLYLGGLTNLKPNRCGFFIYQEESQQAAKNKVLAVMCEEHMLDKVVDAILNDPDGKKIVDEGWIFHIRYNDNENDVAIFDFKVFGKELKKIKWDIAIKQGVTV